jgi:hypothetical protein
MESTAEQKFKQRRERSVFEFYDGQKTRRVDAWMVFINLRDSIPLHVTQINALSGADISSLVDEARKVLDVAKWTEESPVGLNDSEMLALIRELMEFVEAQKKTTDT